MDALLIPNFTKEQTPRVLREVCRILAKVGITPRALPEAKEGLLTHGFEEIPVCSGSSGEEIAACCDFLLSIGGDGTIIRAAHYAAPAGRPVVGINVGRLGFLAHLEPDRLGEGLQRIAQGDYSLEERMALSACSWDGDSSVVSISFAINDIVASKAPGTNIADFEIYCNGRLIDRYAADGIIFSTPTGSTAYGLAAGGPIIDPGLSTISLVPVCPHSMATRPLIFSGDKTIALVCTSGEVQVQADGRGAVLLPRNTMLSIGRSQQSAQFISFNEYEFFEILTTKIKQKG